MSKKKSQAEKSKYSQAAAAGGSQPIAVRQKEEKFVIKQKDRDLLISNPKFIGDVICFAIKTNDLELLRHSSQFRHDVTTKIFFELSTELVKDDENVDILNYLMNEMGVNLNAHKLQDNGSLLHIACLAGKPDVVRLLLSNKNFSVCEVTQQGASSLHLAVRAKHLGIVKLLVEAHADINALNEDRVSPLHLAAIADNSSRIKSEVFANALKPTQEDKQKPGRDGSYIDIKRKNIKINPHPLLESKVPSLDQFDKTTDLYHRVIILGESPEKFLASVDLMVSAKSCPIDLLQDITVKIFALFKIQESTDPSLFARIITKIESLVKKAEVENKYSLILAELYNYASVKALAILKCDEAHHYGLMALESVAEDISQLSKNVILSQIYYNLGISQKSSNYIKAIEYLKKAAEFSPDDQDTIYQQYSTHLQFGDYKKAVEAAEEFSDINTKNILVYRAIVAANEGDLTRGELSGLLSHVKSLPINPKYQLDYFELLVSINRCLGNYEEAICYSDKAISLYEAARAQGGNIQDVDVITAIIRRIYLYQQQSKWVEGLEWFSSIKPEFPEELAKYRDYAPLKFYTFLLYEKNDQTLDANHLLESINQLSCHGELFQATASFANEFRFYNEMGRGNFEAASRCLEHIANENLCSHLRAIIEEARNCEVRTPTPPEANLISNIENEAEAFVILDSIESKLEHEGGGADVELDSHHNVITPELLHRYFQAQKAKIESKKLDQKINKVASWKLSDETTYSEMQENVYKLEGKNDFYVSVDPRLKIDTCKEDLVYQALKKGITSKSHHSVGVKFFGGNIFSEIKINADFRLWSDQIYKNPDGKYLIIYNHQGNHGAVARTMKDKTKVILVNSDAEKYHMEFADNFKQLVHDEFIHEQDAPENVQLAGETSAEE